MTTVYLLQTTPQPQYSPESRVGDKCSHISAIFISNLKLAWQIRIERVENDTPRSAMRGVSRGSGFKGGGSLALASKYFRPPFLAVGVNDDLQHLKKNRYQPEWPTNGYRDRGNWSRWLILIIFSEFGYVLGTPIIVTFLNIASNHSTFWFPIHLFSSVFIMTQNGWLLNGSENTHHNGNHSKRPIRVAGASGGVFDRFRSIEDFAADPTIDVIFGDWMSEISMAFRGSERADRQISLQKQEALSFEMSFIAALKPGIKNIAKNKQKVAVNAGACDAEAMATKVQDICKEYGTDLKVSWVTGDDVTEQVKDLIAKGEKFMSLPSETPIEDWGLEPLFAQCYLGGVGICEALKAGADIVICGRVSDASPVIGAAMWWHGWGREEFDKLGYALIAGHLIECSAYITGGSFTGFKKDLLKANNCTNLGFPIAEIEASGQFIITKETNAGGIVTVETVTAQLIYEIQGPYYYNSDVTANLEKIKLVQEGPNRVRVLGVVGSPPPPTTKVGITAKGGWQAEFHFFLTGLDIKEKAEMVERQTIESMGHYRKDFHTLKFTVTGSVPENPKNQDEATVDLRIFAQTRNSDLVSAGEHKGVAPDTPSFAKCCIENCLQGYPGATPAMDMRQGVGKPYLE
jgi:hypothetical protein